MAQLSLQQRAQGHSVSIGFNVGDAGPDDVQVLRRRNAVWWRPQALRDLLFVLALLVRLRRRRARFDAIHVHGDWSAFAFAPMLAAATGARASVASVHGYVSRAWAFRAIYRLAMRRYGFSYATGRRDAEYLSSVVGRPVHWLTSGVPEAWPMRTLAEAAPAQDIDVLTVATLTAIKDLPAVLAVARRLPHRRFVIVGDGPQRRELQAAAHDIANLSFAGRLDRSEVEQFYRKARTFLLTSLSEGTPTVVLEAMACGLPIVTSASNDYRTLFPDPRQGAIIVNGATDDYALALERFLADDETRQAARSLNAAMAASFTWPRIAATVTAQMQALAGGIESPLEPQA